MIIPRSRRSSISSTGSNFTIWTYWAHVSTRIILVVNSISTKNMNSSCIDRRASVRCSRSDNSGNDRRRFAIARSRCLRSSRYIQSPSNFAVRRFAFTGQHCNNIETTRTPRYWAKSIKRFRSFAIRRHCRGNEHAGAERRERQRPQRRPGFLIAVGVPPLHTKSHAHRQSG